jgi:hypothetical protein
VAHYAKEAWGTFYSPPRESSHWVSEIQTCPDQGPDMSDNRLWNPSKKPDKTGVIRDTADRSDMSGLGVGHVWLRSLELG